jgi:hypothetical protein
MRFSNSWFAVDQAIKISLEESAHPELSGRMMELCATGVRFRTARELTRGSVLQMSWKNTLLVAHVKSCHHYHPGFLVEVELQNVFFGSQARQRQMVLAPTA